MFVLLFPSKLSYAYSEAMRTDRRLAQQTKLLKERNASLLSAVGSVKSNPNASTVLVSTGDDELACIHCVPLIF